VRFWDSSAVVPLLVRQPASGQADKWLADDRDIALWTMTPVEITSALWRLVRETALRDEHARVAERRAQELSEGAYAVVDIEGVKAVAQRLLRVHSLRAADACQLGAALVWAAGRPKGKTLHTLDERLRGAALREGFDVP